MKQQSISSKTFENNQCKDTIKPTEFIGNSSLIHALTSEVETTRILPIANSAKQNQSLDDLLNLVKVNPDEILTEPPTCFEVIGKNHTAIVGTLGNFIAVIGKAKSRKTFLVSLIVSAFVSGDVLMGKLKCFLGSKKRILLFDTEQSKHHVQKVAKRVLATANTNNHQLFETYCLRTFSPKTRLELIKHKIYNTPDAGLVIIDGIRDLVNDINDATEATETVTHLMQWSEERGIHIIVVIHQNKNDNNARGHLGTEIINKAESVLSVAKDANNNDLSIVEPERCREMDFEPFAFGVNENGLPYIVGDWLNAKKDETGKSIVNANNIPDSFHKDRLKEVFAVTSKPKYSDLFKQIKNVFLPYYKTFGDNKAKDFVSYYLGKEWIVKDESTRYPVYVLNQPV